MILLSALLLGLVLARSTRDSPSSSPEFNSLQNETTSSPDAYYVRINATALTTVSAWSSTLAPILAAFMMELWSYRTASRLKRLSQGPDKATLPSPYQFVLLLEMVRGSPTILLQQLKYWLCWTRRKTSTVPILRKSVLMLSLVSILSLLIILADTWLHLTTETVSITWSLNSANADDASLKDFGLSLADQGTLELITTDSFDHGWSTVLSESHGCFDTSRLPCSIDTQFEDAGAPLQNFQGVMQILANTSNEFRLQTSNYRNEAITYVIPAAVPASSEFEIDFTGITYGASTTCKPMSAKCGLKQQDDTGFNWEFDCSKQHSSFKHKQNAKQGSLLYENHTLYSDDSYAKSIPWDFQISGEISQGNENGEWFPTKNMVNPAFPAVVMVSENNPGLSQNSDSDIVDIGQLAQAMIAFCKHTIFDVHYSYTNATYSVIDTKVSNQTVADITNIPLMLGHPQHYIESQVDAIMSSSNSTQIVGNYSLTYSQASMAILAGVLDPAAASSIQFRRDILVTRVPKAPLFTLIALNLLFAALGLVLTLSALQTLIGGHDGAVADVKARLGVAGLTAECFEREEDGLLDREIDDETELFGEKYGARGVKVGVQQQQQEGKAKGGWRLKRYDVEEKSRLP
ncbi:MAG: hypothetical protein Q9227_007629 [Pyrenula ochraceoflavens]